MNVTSAIIIIVVILFAFYLIYSQNKNSAMFSNFRNPPAPIVCEKCKNDRKLESPMSDTPRQQPPLTANVVIEHNDDPYSDPIKKQDTYSMYDPLTYPQARLPREILEKYQEYYDKNGNYPPFAQFNKPMFDNPILNGVLIRIVDENEPFVDSTPITVPLFRVKSSKNSNRFFYYIIDQRYNSKLELKIPLDNIKINTVRFNNAEYYGLPEIYDGDVLENISIFPGSKFKALIYKTHHFP
jgi:hypothetical protein